MQHEVVGALQVCFYCSWLFSLSNKTLHDKARVVFVQALAPLLPFLSVHVIEGINHHFVTALQKSNQRQLRKILPLACFLPYQRLSLSKCQHLLEVLLSFLCHPQSDIRSALLLCLARCQRFWSSPILWTTVIGGLCIGVGDTNISTSTVALNSLIDMLSQPPSWLAHAPQVDQAVWRSQGAASFEPLVHCLRAHCAELVTQHTTLARLRAWNVLADVCALDVKRQAMVVGAIGTELQFSPFSISTLSIDLTVMTLMAEKLLSLPQLGELLKSAFASSPLSLPAAPGPMLSESVMAVLSSPTPSLSTLRFVYLQPLFAQLAVAELSRSDVSSAATPHVYYLSMLYTKLGVMIAANESDSLCLPLERLMESWAHPEWTQRKAACHTIVRSSLAGNVIHMHRLSPVLNVLPELVLAQNLRSKQEALYYFLSVLVPLKVRGLNRWLAHTFTKTAIEHLDNDTLPPPIRKSVCLFLECMLMARPQSLIAWLDSLRDIVRRIFTLQIPTQLYDALCRIYSLVVHHASSVAIDRAGEYVDYLLQDLGPVLGKKDNSDPLLQRMSAIKLKTISLASLKAIGAIGVQAGNLAISVAVCEQLVPLLHHMDADIRRETLGCLSWHILCITQAHPGTVLTVPKDTHVPLEALSLHAFDTTLMVCWVATPLLLDSNSSVRLVAHASPLLSYIPLPSNIFYRWRFLPAEGSESQIDDLINSMNNLVYGTPAPMVAPVLMPDGLTAASFTELLALTEPPQVVEQSILMRIDTDSPPHLNPPCSLPAVDDVLKINSAILRTPIMSLSVVKAMANIMEGRLGRFPEGLFPECLKKIQSFMTIPALAGPAALVLAGMVRLSAQSAYKQLIEKALPLMFGLLHMDAGPTTTGAILGATLSLQSLAELDPKTVLSATIFHASALVSLKEGDLRALKVIQNFLDLGVYFLDLKDVE
jgi:hypothetical protein